MSQVDDSGDDATPAGTTAPPPAPQEAAETTPAGTTTRHDKTAPRHGGQTLSQEDIEDLLNITWEVGAATKRAATALWQGKNRRRYAEQVEAALKRLEKKAAPLESDSQGDGNAAQRARTRKKDIHRAKSLIQYWLDYGRVRNEYLQLIRSNKPISLDSNAEVVADSLQSARAQLKHDDADLSVIQACMTEAERAIIFLYPPPLIKARANSVLVKLESSGSHEATLVATQIREAMTAQGDDVEIARQALVDGVETRNKLVRDEENEEDLQVTRLSKVRWYVLLLLAALLLAALLLASPIIVNYSPIGTIPSTATGQSQSVPTTIGQTAPTTTVQAPQPR